MLLGWRIPGAASAVRAVPVAPVAPASTVEMDGFKQNNLFSGYVMIKYNLSADGGKIHVRVFDSANPESANWFNSPDVVVKSGTGLTLVKMNVPTSSTGPDLLFKTDSIEIQLLDDSGNNMTSLKTQTPLNWAKPK